MFDLGLFQELLSGWLEVHKLYSEEYKQRSYVLLIPFNILHKGVILNEKLYYLFCI
jgi:hypothetical protein